jgi:peptide methionine sulfoxide reductase MsrA
LRIDYDPSLITFNKILDIFWEGHDPKVRCKKQYQSTIFYHDQEQKDIAINSMKNYELEHGIIVSTVIQKIGCFHLAENYHQKFYLRHDKSLMEELNLNDERIMNDPIATRFNCYVSGNGNRDQFLKDAKELNLSERLTNKLLKNLH